jgi:hypothetical protein
VPAPRGWLFGPQAARARKTASVTTFIRMPLRNDPGGMEVTDACLLAEPRLYDVAKQRTGPMTWRGYEHLVRLHILPTLGRVRLAKLTTQHVRSLVTQKVREGRLSPRTIQYMHSVLRASLNQPFAGGWSTRNQSQADLGHLEVLPNVGAKPPAPPRRTKTKLANPRAAR